MDAPKRELWSLLLLLFLATKGLEFLTFYINGLDPNQDTTEE